MISGLIKKAEESLYKSRVNPALHVVLCLLSFVYGVMVRVRNYFYYEMKLCSRKRLGVPVISIGNITVGGSGKTPMAIYLASMLGKAGLRAVILSRGYKSAGYGVREITKDNLEAALKDGELYGDEPLLMARRLQGTPIVVCPDRAKGGEYAIKKYSPDVVILDDGFQHARLVRDLDIVLIDGKRGIGSGYMLPRGPLREPLSQLKRADLLLIKGSGPFVEEVRKFDKPMVGFSYKGASLVDKNNESRDLNFIKGEKIMALSAIANPASFIETLKDMGAEIIHSLEFSDHHWFRAPDVDRIKRESVEADLIITTEKDMVRLIPYAMDWNKMFALRIEVETDEQALLSEILKITRKRASGIKKTD